MAETQGGVEVTDGDREEQATRPEVARRGCQRRELVEHCVGEGGGGGREEEAVVPGQGQRKSQ